MNRSTILVLLMLVSSVFLFPGCVVPADDYYSDPYYSPGVVVVPALPYSVNLYERPYYTYRGYYYFYNNQRWYYSRTKGGNWITLPRTHWPYDTRWKGRHFHNDHREHKYDRHDNRRPSKDSKHRPKRILVGITKIGRRTILTVRTHGIMTNTNKKNIQATKTRVERILYGYKRIQRKKTDDTMKWTNTDSIQKSGPWSHVNRITTK